MIDALLRTPWIAIALGGAFGAVTRFALAQAFAGGQRAFRRTIDPGHATAAANLLACFLLGAVTALAASAPPLATAGDLSDAPSTLAGSRAALTAFATTGFCGSLSTFSTLCADFVRAIRAKAHGRLALFTVFHALGGPAAFAAGVLAGG